MITGIVEIVAAVLGWAAAKGIDAILGKWVAYATIAWQKHATQSALDAYAAGMKEFQQQVNDSGGWDAWRKKVGIVR